MECKKTITAIEALKATADHLGTFYYLFNLSKEEDNEADHIIGTMAGVVASHSENPIPAIEFAGSKEDWLFAIDHMKAFMQLKGLADDGNIQYSEHKDGYGFPIFEVSASDVRRMKKIEQTVERIRKAKMRETLQAKVYEAVEKVFFENGGAE